MDLNHNPRQRGRDGSDESSCNQAEVAENASCSSCVSEPIVENASVAPSRMFKIEGMDCAEEVAILKKAVGPLVGGENYLAFDVINGRMSIFDSPKSPSEKEIETAVHQTGMSARIWDPSEKQSISEHYKQQRFFTIASGSFLILGILIHILTSKDLMSALRLFDSHGGIPMPWTEIGAYFLATLLGARYVAVKAVYALRNLRPDMNLLMTIAVSGAMLIGEWFEAATVSFLFALSLLLESWSLGRARNAIAALLELAPPIVRVKNADGTEIEMMAADVSLGTTFLARAGDRIALDGVVISGKSSVNQAPITGESIPVYKSKGDEVFAGTINGDGTLEVRCSKAADDTVLARIIKLVGETHNRRAPSEQWVEKFARIYTPLVMAMAVLVLLVPPIAFEADWSTWLYNSLVLLVIACPCALVISTPVSIVSALAAAARQGVLVKGGAYLELPSKLKALALDKTGTLTKGEPEVVKLYPLNDHSVDELLIRAAALEARSSHPLAIAILSYANSKGISIVPAENVEILPGKGVTGLFEDENYWLGSHRYAVERGQSTIETSASAEALEEEGHTVVAIGNERHICGLIALADGIRPEAKQIISRLHNLGVEHVVMLTGDNFATANAVAKAVEIDDIRAELLPEDKVVSVENLTRQYQVVAMIGDGINDAPAMARADFAIAMGAIGSDAAIETADIALMTDDLSRVSWLIEHSRRTLRIIYQNISFSISVKLLFAVLMAIGYATLWGAIAADVGASLLVVANALRLLRPTTK